MTAPTAPLMSKAEIKAAQAAHRAADDKAAKALATAALKNLPEHTFGTGSIGRSVRRNVEVTDPATGAKRKAFINVVLTFSDTVKKDAAPAA